MIEGDTIPDLTLDIGGKPVALSSFRGRLLILYFYPKDDTSGCTREAQDFTALMPDFAKAGMAVVGASKDSAAKHAKFTGKYGLTVPLAADVDGALCEAFGVWIEKSLYGRKYMGIERATFLIGKDARVARVWHKVKVAGHAAEVFAAARALV